MGRPDDRNLTWHPGKVSPERRRALLGQRGAVVWLTGLSGSGKSTLAVELEHALLERGHVAFVLDGDNVRHGLNADLGFGEADRTENIRRVGHVARLFADAGVIVLTAFISPFRADRAAVRALLPDDAFLEVHVSTPLAVCEARDPKGLYARARAGEIPHFTGISSPYEAPERPDLAVDTAHLSLDRCVERLFALLTARGVLAGGRGRTDQG